MEDKIRILPLTREIAEVIVRGEREQGWENASMEKYELRLLDAAEGRAVALAALFNGEPAGYINVYPDSPRGGFGGMGLPEIVDFGVLEKFRGRGIGSRLMDEAEKIAASYAGTVYLGVGLHSGYGSAQRMYLKRGYLPDGKGVYYQGAPAVPYSEVTNDDELALYLSKVLKK